MFNLLKSQETYTDQNTTDANNTGSFNFESKSRILQDEKTDPQLYSSCEQCGKQRSYFLSCFTKIQWSQLHMISNLGYSEIHRKGYMQSEYILEISILDLKLSKC